MREQEKTPGRRPRRYRPTLWALVHNVIWSVLLAAAWAPAVLFRMIERVRRHV